MGPPGDRKLHMSTERTEDLSWIVDLSWHGMRQGEPEVVTTEEKERKKTSAANTSKLQTWKAGVDFFCLANNYFAIQLLSLIGYNWFPWADSVFFVDEVVNKARLKRITFSENGVNG